ncbi:MAG: hypothetical protein GY769_11330 [bacterium]|nr:hypothetical protein [bacterium]
MSSLTTSALKRPLRPVLLATFLAALTACSERAEVTQPLLAISGPNDFTSFEVRASNGAAIWRLEADTPTGVGFLVYPIVPDGFRQVFPRNEPPRPLELGEDLVIESRIPNRVFIHRAFARTETTITILESEMRRTDLGDPRDPLPR